MEDYDTSPSNILSKLNNDVICQFFHATIDEICGNDKMTFQRFTNSLQWSENEYKIVRRYAFELFKDPALLYLDDERMPQRFVEAPAELQLAIRKCVAVRREQLIKALLNEYSIKNGTTILLDFDWKLKWVMGSSKLATLKEPLMQLDLIVEDRKSQRILDLELNRDELEMLINVLENVET